MASVSEYDRANMRGILLGEGDWFSAHLYRLIVKADFKNKAKLRLAFPEHVRAVESYLEGESA